MDLLASLAVAQGLSDALGSRPLVALVLLFGAGVLTSLTPCIYPMIPITVGVIGGTAGAEPRRRRTVVLTLTYVTGLAMLDVIPISAPERLSAWASRLEGGTVPAVFPLGATSGRTWVRIRTRSSATR
ncbi:MAG: hypothetical protein JSV86_10130 [Gemmatimonadota bacterium]|nr:MAG: hypothetical protein JSV86_10130 [Gemmatimonadota bacterium]